MRKILVINGPNLNMLGKRDPNLYGLKTLEEINLTLTTIAQENEVDLIFFQSNHEGALIDFIQSEYQNANGILINPGALTHYGYSLRDCLEQTNIPIVEVHVSDIEKREEFRKIDVLDGIVLEKIVGLKEQSYFKGLKVLIEKLRI